MAKPKVTLHVFTSLDGRITGDFGKANVAKQSAKLFNSVFSHDSHPFSFQPIKLKTYPDGTLWLRYRPVLTE